MGSQILIRIQANVLQTRFHPSTPPPFHSSTLPLFHSFTLPPIQPSFSACPPLSRPVVLFDGDCDFCRCRVDRWKASCGDRIGFLPYREAMDRFPVLSERDLKEAVHLVEPDGAILNGAAAVVRLRELGMGRRLLARMYRNHRWFAACCEWGYRRVARNRSLFSCLTRPIVRRKCG